MLTHVITQANRVCYGRLLTQMFQQRYQVFVAEKKWKLAVHNGLERDGLDDLESVVYHAVIDERGDLIGSNRFVPGDGPTLSSGPLRNYWRLPFPRDRDSWEVSRTIAAPNRNYKRFAEACAAIAVGTMEWAYGRAIKTIFGVGDARFVGGMVNCGWQIAPHGLPIDYPEGGRGIAVSWPVDLPSLEATRASYGFRKHFMFEAPVPLDARELTPSECALFSLIAETPSASTRERYLGLILAEAARLGGINDQGGLNAA